jgi:hypothetical protein
MVPKRPKLGRFFEFVFTGGVLFMSSDYLAQNGWSNLGAQRVQSASDGLEIG